MLNKQFWSDQRVFMTGHTGFKGGWTAKWLATTGAYVAGYALPPSTSPSLYSMLFPLQGVTSVFGDILDIVNLEAAVSVADPTIAIHMAAQPLVRLSYREPANTYAVNVMGTLNVLEALRKAPNLKAIIIVTTDKVYRNDDSGHVFVESDPLGGHDPYSSSKAACEEVVSCYHQSYFSELGIAIATVRAGNVVGGGDWSEDRLLPDIWRAMQSGEPLVLRNPLSTRPWQHVLDPVSGYLNFAEKLHLSGGQGLPRALNFAPVADAPLNVQAVAEMMGEALGLEKAWVQAEGFQPVEMKLLALDSSLARRSIGWKPSLTGREAIQWTADWFLNQRQGGDCAAFTAKQIAEYEARSAASAISPLGAQT
jgi:CDP-glucose 4,6-dehydratase